MLLTGWKTAKYYILLLTAAFILISLASLSFGQIDIPLLTVVKIIISKLGVIDIYNGDFTQQELSVIWYIRLPRLLVGLFVGAALAVAGATLQGIFGNHLADPGIIGVSAGAGAGAVFAIAIGVSSVSIFIMPLFAFTGSIVAVALTVFLAMQNKKIPVMTLLLAGVAVGMLLGAVTTGLLTFMNQQQLQQYLFWMVGGLDYRRWEHVYMVLFPVAFGLTFLILMARSLNILALGESEARTVGMPVMRYRFVFLALASLITASAVCVSGNISFVGLIIPHMMRMLCGPDHRIFLPVSALAGATFLIACDFLGRTIMTPIEVRTGIITALLGTPYFLYLLRKTALK